MSAAVDTLPRIAAATHTPGPWRWDHNSLRAATPDPEHSAVHTILHAEGGCGYLASNVHDTLRELDADMALIAQAPTMLGLFQEVLGSLDSAGTARVSDELHHQIVTAIVAATGTQA